MGKSSLAALDSNSLSYLLDAVHAGEEPAAHDPLREEKLALVRIMLYDEWGLYVTPQVGKECARIRNVSRAELHASWLNSIFTEVQPVNATRIEARASELLSKHVGRGDCQMVAEAEDAGIRVLLTSDVNFISRLSASTSVKLLRPTSYWTSLNLPIGTRPRTLPHDSNPLAAMRWWRWE